MRLGLALRAFFRVLSDGGFATELRPLLEGPASRPASSPEVATAPPKAPAPPPPPTQSEALTLLAALQREARLVDLIREPLEQYEDAQIGVAAREVLRDSRQVLDRFFALQPVADLAEGEATEAPADYDAGCYRLTGQVSGSGPHRGTLMHAGWRATRCELPKFHGSADAAMIVAPAEIEIQ